LPSDFSVMKCGEKRNAAWGYAEAPAGGKSVGASDDSLPGDFLKAAVARMTHRVNIGARPLVQFCRMIPNNQFQRRGGYLGPPPLEPN
jgi:hypothetical protein